MQCARSDNGNVVAESALRLDREVGLMRYHGLGGYVTAKGGVRALLLPSGSSSDDAAGGFNLTRFLFGPPSGHGREASVSAADTDAGTSKSTGATSSAKKARVAFMITATQRQQLSTELGYTAGDIRSLKPLEALLILEHQIKPGNDEEVRRLVNENEEIERQEAERAAREIAASAAKDEKSDTSDIKEDILHTIANTAACTEGNIGNTSDEDSATLALAAGASTNGDAGPSQSNQNKEFATSLSSAISDQSAAVQQALSRPLSGDDQAQDVPNPDTVSTSNESGDMTWYEVVETKVDSDLDGAVIALYQSLEEAEDCLKWKEGRGKGKFLYQIRQRT